jgi:hypothetical protein
VDTLAAVDDNDDGGDNHCANLILPIFFSSFDVPKRFPTIKIVYKNTILQILACVEKKGNMYHNMYQKITIQVYEVTFELMHTAL